MKRTIIGLHGTPGAGKDTVANRMRATHGFHVFAFADAVKRELVAAFDVSPTLFSERHLKGVATKLLSLGCTNHVTFVSWYLSTAAGELEAAHLGAGVLTLPRTPRWLMQTYGTDFRRSVNDNYWLDRMTEKLDTIPIDEHVVISDVRFENEAEYVKRESDVNEIWEIVRMNNPWHNKNDRHVSNQRLPSVDKVIFNAGTVNQLWRKVDRAVEKVL